LLNVTTFMSRRRKWYLIYKNESI